MDEGGLGNATGNQIGELLSEIDRLLDQLNENFSALNRTMVAMAIDSGNSGDEAIEHVQLIKNLANRLRSFDRQPDIATAAQMFQLLIHSRQLLSDGSQAWDRIGDDLLKIAAETFAHEADNFPNTQSPYEVFDRPVMDRFHSDWQREPFTINAFQAMMSLPDSPEKWLLYLRYMSHLQLNEIADLVGITPPALNMRMNRILAHLSSTVIKESLRDIASFNHNMDITFGEEDVLRTFDGDLEIDLGFDLRVKLAIIVLSADRSRLNTNTVLSGLSRLRNMSGDRRIVPFIPAVCIYDRRSGEIFMFAAERQSAAWASLNDTGKFGPVLSDEELFPALRRQITNVLSELGNTDESF